jgi:hypothetical protein
LISSAIVEKETWRIRPGVSDDADFREGDIFIGEISFPGIGPIAIIGNECPLMGHAEAKRLRGWKGM